MGQEIFGFPGVGWIPEEVAYWDMVDRYLLEAIGIRNYEVGDL